MVRQLFESETNCEIAGEATNGREAVAKAARIKPDLDYFGSHIDCDGRFGCGSDTQKSSAWNSPYFIYDPSGTRS